MRWSSLALTLALVACGAESSAPKAAEVAGAPSPEKAEPKAEPEAEPEAEPKAEPEAEPEAELEPSEKPPIYEERAITDDEYGKALAQAKAENKNVLLMFGGNWCSWCHKLHELMEADSKIKSTLEGGFVRVMVDSHTNDALIEKLDIELKGVPFLVVVDPSGKILVRQETGSLEDGPKHDPGRVLAFLVEWQPAA
jgi:thioredoxin-related protein